MRAYQVVNYIKEVKNRKVSLDFVKIQGEPIEITVMEKFFGSVLKDMSLK